MDTSFSFRHPTSADLPHVNRLYRREYGDAYPYQMREDDLASGIAFVAFAGEELVGCARAIRPNPAAPVYLFGGMIVDPPHRRHHVARALTDLRFDAVVRAGAKVVATEPVCCQPSCASQRNMVAHGFLPLGILPAKYPDIKPETLGDQPESLTLAVRWLEGEVSFEGRPLFLGARVDQLLCDTAPALHATAGTSFLRGPMPDPEFHEPMRGTRGRLRVRRRPGQLARVARNHRRAPAHRVRGLRVPPGPRPHPRRNALRPRPPRAHARTPHPLRAHPRHRPPRPAQSLPRGALRGVIDHFPLF